MKTYAQTISLRTCFQRLKNKVETIPPTHPAKCRNQAHARRDRCIYRQTNWQVSDMPPLYPHKQDLEKQCNSQKSWSHRPQLTQWDSSGESSKDHPNQCPKSRIERRLAKRKWEVGVEGEDKECGLREGIDLTEMTNKRLRCHGSPCSHQGSGFPGRARTPRNTRRVGPLI